jgi:hypothetical protein
MHNVWDSAPPTDIDTRLFGPAVDAFASADPMTYGPYTLAEIASSQDTYLGSGKYQFQTATNAAEEWLAAPLGAGLHLITHQNALNSGDSFAVPFTTTLGSAYLSPHPIVIQACEPAGSAPFTFTASLPLDGLAGDAFGLSLSEAYPAQQAGQDDPLLPATASYTLPLAVQHGGLIEAEITGSSGDDLDLYLLYDQNDDGIFDWSSEIIASSLNAGSQEGLRLDFPADGAYRLAVHGLDVLSPPALFDLRVLVIQGSDLSLAALPPGAFPAGSAALQFNWMKSPAAGELWRGRLALGSLYLPHAAYAEVYLLPCDASGLLAQAGFSWNAPLTWGTTAQFSNTSTGEASLSYLWDFGDGSPVSTLAEPQHDYAAPGSYTVTLTASNAFSQDSLSQVVQVSDIPPALHSLDITQPLFEGGAAQLSGAILDAGYPGAYQLSVEWGDGSHENHPYPQGTAAFSLAHTYADDLPSHTASDPYEITVTITDSLEMTSTALLPFTLSNAAPRLEAGAGIIVPARLPFTRAGAFIDPGADTWGASVDYGDGGAQPLALDGQSYLLEHSYSLPGVYTVTVRVVDDDQGFAEDSFIVTVLAYRVSLPAIFHAAFNLSASPP